MSQTDSKQTGSRSLDNYIPGSEDYPAALSDLFGLMPRLVSLDITLGNCRAQDANNRRFLETFGAFLHTASLEAITIRGFTYDLDLQQIFSYLENTGIKRVTLQQNTQHDYYYYDRNTTTEQSVVTRLPAVEYLRVDMRLADVFEKCMKHWMSEHQTMFPDLKHLEVSVDQEYDLIVWSRVLQQAFTLRLDSFRLNLGECALFHDGLVHPNTHLFDGVHFKHFKVAPQYAGSALCLQKWFNWFCAKLCRLVKSGAPIQFVELTLSIVDDFSGEHNSMLTSTYGALDAVLSDDAFNGVERIHFEKVPERIVVTELSHPEVVSSIRRICPRLRRKGVLCFL
ncbi:hypothetical protein CPB85DRAFT_1441551 [Mucidula mucida]|nr:hypothetical protein CPB85DRAFT_1441551 [Mucidula mucida]